MVEDANSVHRKLDEIAAKQRQRETEAEERRAEERRAREREGPRRVPTVPVSAHETPAAEPVRRTIVPTKPGGWRDREEARAASGPPNGSGDGGRIRDRERETGNTTPAPVGERKRLNLAGRTLPREDIPVPPQVAERLSAPSPSNDAAPGLPPPKEGVYRPGALSGRKLQAERPDSPLSGAEGDKPPQKYVPRHRENKDGESGGAGGRTWGRR